MSLRCVVLISGAGSLLPALLDGIHRAGGVAAELTGVVSNRPAAAGLELARDAGLPVRVVDHRRYPDRRGFETDLAAAIRDLGADLLVFAGFMRILTPEFITGFAPWMLNTHPSLLPDFPGLDTHARVLARGDETAGASVHMVTPALDAGPIIARVQVPVARGDDASALSARVRAGERHLFPEVIRWVAAGRLDLTRSPPQLDGTSLPPLGMQFRICAEGIEPMPEEAH